MSMHDDVKSFCQGYLEGALACNADLTAWDDWVLWGGFDIQFSGPEHDSLATTPMSLACDVYEAGWATLPDEPLYRFVVMTTVEIERSVTND